MSYTKIFIFLFWVVSLGVVAQSTLDVASKVEKVTVYQQGARVQEKASVKLPLGDCIVKIQDIPSSMDVNSLQVSGKGDFMIMGVKTVSKQAFEISIKAKRIEDSIDIIAYEVNILQEKDNVLKLEEDVILENKKISGNDGLDPAALELMADFVRERISEIRITKLDIKRGLKVKQELLDDLNKRLRKENQLQRSLNNEIWVSLTSSKVQTANLTIEYNTYNASWNPIYNVRVAKENTPVKITYNAQVAQNTGKDWENVKLVISTGSPQSGVEKPVLNNWFLDFYTPVPVYRKNSVNMGAMRMEKSMQMDEMVEEEPMAMSIAAQTVTQTNSFNSEFQIQPPYTIISGKESQTVEVKNLELKAENTFYTAPKIDPNVYQLARISDWKNTDMISGDAFVFYEGALLNKIYLNTADVYDTLEVPLGESSQVLTQRKELKEFKSKKLIGSNYKEERAFEISVINKSDSKVEVLLEDQIPVSKNSEIEVETQELSGAKLDANSGKLSWNVSLAPKEEKKFVIKFTIKYPKNKNISGL